MCISGLLGVSVGPQLSQKVITCVSRWSGISVGRQVGDYVVR